MEGKYKVREFSPKMRVTSTKLFLVVTGTRSYPGGYWSVVTS